MGIYGDYLKANIAQSAEALNTERKQQLRRISELRGGRDVLVFAADLSKEVSGIQTAVSFPDLLPINDQLSNLKGTKLDLILETPGGLGEVAEEIVREIRTKYDEFAVIVPGWAKSAGTIMAMAADEILMGPGSALGPIDAQLFWQGKRFSAGALLDGMDKIKAEVQETGYLNKAYIPILQGISPGELQGAQNALNFSTRLVSDWLRQFKFKNWTVHSSTGQPVTEDEKRARAEEIADKLCDHSRWHPRSVHKDAGLARDAARDSRLFREPGPERCDWAILRAGADDVFVQPVQNLRNGRIAGYEVCRSSGPGPTSTGPECLEAPGGNTVQSVSGCVQATTKLRGSAGLRPWKYGFS